MRTKFFLTALALGMASGLLFAGEPGEDSRFRNDRPRHQGESGGHGQRDRQGDRRGRAQRPGMNGGMRAPGAYFGREMLFAERLGLTAEQKTQFVAVLTEDFRSNLELQIQMADAMRKVREIAHDENASSDSIIAANRELGEIRGRMQALRGGLKAKLAAILTPEQKETLGDIRRPARRDDWRPGPRGFWNGGMPPPPPVRHGDWRPGPRDFWNHDAPPPPPARRGDRRDRGGWRPGPHGFWNNDADMQDDDASDDDMDDMDDDDMDM